jgi:hypothetical protein
MHPVVGACCRREVPKSPDDAQGAKLVLGRRKEVRVIGRAGVCSGLHRPKSRLFVMLGVVCGTRFHDHP